MVSRARYDYSLDYSSDSSDIYVVSGIARAAIPGPISARLFAGIIAAGTTAHAQAKPSLLSHDCQAAISRASAKERGAKVKPCTGTTHCGDFPTNPHPFTTQLSPQCAALLGTYRSLWSKIGLSNTVTHHKTRPCTLRRTTAPRNPVVISSNSTATFVLCTAPKAGCTNLRKLMHAIISDPVHTSTDAYGQFAGVHFARYPTVWHYDLPVPAPTGASPTPSITPQPSRSLSTSESTTAGALWQPLDTSVSRPALSGTPQAASPTPPPAPSGNPASTVTTPPPSPSGNPAPTVTTPPPRIPATVPSFIIGRNPYVRLLSGFLDKMTHNPELADTYTHGAVNRHLGLPPHALWTPTFSSFHSFVRTLARRGVADVDPHFRPVIAACAATFRFDYYLPLEDIHRWLPCWADGLAVRRWLESGWTETPHGRMYVGGGRHFITLQSHRVKRSERPKWDDDAGTATHGEEGVDWAWVSGDSCWWKPHDQTCEQYFSSFTLANGTIVPGAGEPFTGRPWDASAGSGDRRALRVDTPKTAASNQSTTTGDVTVDGDVGGDAHDTHDTGSRERWQDFYTQEIADLVFSLYTPDFDAFGYKRYVVGEAAVGVD